MPANNMTRQAPDSEDKQKKLFAQNEQQITGVVNCIQENKELGKIS